MKSPTQAGTNELQEQPFELRIPFWAGQVRDVLKESGPLSLASLTRSIGDATTNEVAMAVGWLAHAGELRFRKREALWMIDLQRAPQPTADPDEQSGPEA